MVQESKVLAARLEGAENEVRFYKREIKRISDKYLRELEEQSKYTSLLKEKIKISDSHQHQLAMILDSIPADIYISDMDDYKVLFMNAFMKKSFKRDCVGSTCWEVFQRREDPCPHCTNDELKKNIGNSDKVITWEKKNPVNKKWYLNYDTAVSWINGKRVRMQIAIDISTRIKTEQALEKSRIQYHSLSRMLRLMCDNVPDMIWAKDMDGRYLFANTALCKSLLNTEDTEEPVGKTDLFFAERERNSHRDTPDWHTFGEVCQDSDTVTMETGKSQQFEEFGNVKKKFLFLDVYKAPFLDENGEMIGTVGSARDVTIARKNEAKLREKEAKDRKKIEDRYQTIIDTTQEGVCSIDENYDIIFANKKMANILGYAVSEFLGKNLCDFILPSDQKEYFSQLKKRTVGLNKSYEQRFRHKNGQDCWLRVSATAIANELGDFKGSFHMFTDITEVKRASQQLLENFERLKMAQTVGKIGSWEYDIATEKLWISEEGYKICGIIPESESEILSKKLMSYLPGTSDGTPLSGKIEGKADNNEVEFTVLSNDHNELRYIRSVSEWITNNHGKPLKIVGVLQDISGQQKAEIALKETHTQLLHAEKLSAIGKLSASIAHEFNNPLQGVLNIISGVQERSKLSAEDAELMEMAVAECKRMRGLIVSLQDFNKPTHSRLDLVNLQTMIDSLLLLSRQEILQHKLTIRTIYKENFSHVKVIGDQLKQVFLNLLKNAIDACRQGDTITIELDDSLPSKIQIHVSDTGCGIKPEDLDQVFNPFYTTKPDLKGTGLGLSVSYGIIKNHGGRIDVASNPGEGSIFTVTLPLDGGL